LPQRHSSGKLNVIGPKDDPKRYEVLEELGQGATATVYRCMKGDEMFAVKTISLAKLRLQRDFQRIQDTLHREVQILFSLRHRRIVSLFDVVEEQDKLHLVMELVEGKPGLGNELFDYIVASGSFPEHVARYVFLQITEGLKYIHSKDIVYRDLKPENILVDHKASREDLLEIKLSDFGHSKLINDGYSTALTRVGTPQYWAPEVSDPQKAALGYDQNVDLWSLGVVLYVMLIGSYPFDGIGERIEDQIRKPPNFRAQGSSQEVSELAQDLIRALMVVEPKKRLPLDQCLSHPWSVSKANSCLSQVMNLKLKTEMDPRMVELRLQIPIEVPKEKVQQLRRDLQEWMMKFHSSATIRHQEIIATLRDETRVEAARRDLIGIVEHNFGVKPMDAPRPVGSGLPAVQEGTAREEGDGGGYGGARRPTASFRTVYHTLRVSGEHGAGLDLLPERGGMRVEAVYPEPGQPGLQERDLITKINEVSLRGTPETVEEVFGSHFCDGAQLAVRRIR